jgi:hypothetical protein
MSIDHVSRAKKAWPLLVQRAKEKNGSPFTYGELCAELGLHPRSASWFLGVIQSYCKRHNLPPLQALVVNKKTRLPGRGYTGSPSTRDDHDLELSKVRKYRWPSKAPDLNT